MIYTDGAHLVAESLRELCDYGNAMGLNLRWLELGEKSITPHLHICGKVKERILADKRVKQVSPKEIIRICKLNFRQPETKEDIKEWEEYHGKKFAEVYKPSERDFEKMFSNIFKKCGIS